MPRYLLNALALLLIAFAANARAEERIALVVGNGAYDAIGTLKNPVNDAELIAATLRDMGFTVTSLINANQAEMKRGIADFGRALRQAGTKSTGLFYYAGHGVQSFRTNYLLPVDTVLSDAADLPLVAVEAQSVLRQMFSARNRTNIVILDACRNNPFENVPAFDDNGLAEMQAPTGSFLAYATGPGAVAFDGADGNSPFTRALAAGMRRPGLPIEQMFKQVRIAVRAETGGEQTPWDTSSLTSDFAFAEAEAEAPDAGAAAARNLWDSVRIGRDSVQIMLFLRAYPESRYTAEARGLLAEVMQAELTGAPAPATPAPPAPAPSAPAPAGPSDQEQALFEATQIDPGVASYAAYLDAYPDGLYSEFVRVELAALEAKATTDPVGEGVSPELPPTAAVAAPLPAGAGPIGFDSPLAAGGEPVQGRSLAELIEGSPSFPPFEGLPDELWKGQPCAGCHQWDQTRLCTQAGVYLTMDAARITAKPHPYGGGFKQGLAAWASHDCP